MYIFLMIIHVILSIALVLIILAQSSKGGALDGLVGGTASSMLGSHGASEFLTKWTKILGGVWMLSSLFLAMNVRQMTEPQRARALERLRREGSAAEQPVDMDSPVPAEQAIPVEPIEGGEPVPVEQ